MGHDVAVNKALNGRELKQIVMRDVEAMLNQDGMLAPHIAYGQVSFEVTVKFHTGRPIEPTWKNTITSGVATKQEIEGSPGIGLDALETFPLKDAGEDAVASGRRRRRAIVSPNEARIKAGIPIDIVVTESNGQIVEKPITYSVDDLPEELQDEDLGVQDSELTSAEVLAKE